jgi:lysine-specific demethylase 8
MVEGQKRELVDIADGYCATIHPGEAIYMPMLIWHYLEYTDNAMSFSFRFGRNKYGRFLCVDNFHRDCYIQNFASKLADKMVCEQSYKDAIASVIDEYKKPTANVEAKVRGMRALFKKLCAESCPDARLEQYCPPEREREELERIMRDTEQTMRYADPKVIIQTRPVGPVSPLQKAHIEKLVLTCEYSPKTLQRTLSNRTGKTCVDLLTKAEAVQFMSYLKSPGAPWGQTAGGADVT